MSTEEAAAWAREYVAPVKLRPPERDPFVATQRDPEPPMRGSLFEVPAAHFAHRITGDQYEALMNAYLENERAEQFRR